GDWEIADSSFRAEGEGGPKALLRGIDAGDFQLDVEIRADAGGARAGVIFRGSDIGEGAEAYRGHYAGIDADRNLLVWGAMDPDWRSIASRPLAIEPGSWYHLRILAAGENVKIYLD